MDRNSRVAVRRSTHYGLAARVMSAVAVGGNAELVSVCLLVPFGEPGRFQVEVPLQSSAGGGADGAGLVEPGEFRAFGAAVIGLPTSDPACWCGLGLARRRG